MENKEPCELSQNGGRAQDSQKSTRFLLRRLTLAFPEASFGYWRILSKPLALHVVSAPCHPVENESKTTTNSSFGVYGTGRGKEPPSHSQKRLGTNVSKTRRPSTWTHHSPTREYGVISGGLGKTETCFFFIQIPHVFHTAVAAGNKISNTQKHQNYRYEFAKQIFTRLRVKSVEMAETSFRIFASMTVCCVCVSVTHAHTQTHACMTCWEVFGWLRSTTKRLQDNNASGCTRRAEVHATTRRFWDDVPRWWHSHPDNTAAPLISFPSTRIQICPPQKQTTNFSHYHLSFVVLFHSPTGSK